MIGKQHCYVLCFIKQILSTVNYACGSFIKIDPFQNLLMKRKFLLFQTNSANNLLTTNNLIVYEWWLLQVDRWSAHLFSILLKI